ncbi:MAG: hypothetical protein EOO02_19950 [Chitinophagaceae bacterium]|nr:MAG: hypothetical protein EOO02_19950 [Chitinophagaceae bacterium]
MYVGCETNTPIGSLSDSMRLATLTQYPQASNYYLQNGVPVDDLHFGRPKEFYFPASNDYINANTSYTNYYMNQVSELTNINLVTIEVDMVLNELDISNLDLRTPVFIDFGEYGHGYFKVLSVEYVSNKLLSEVKLQKVVLGTDR